MGIFILIVLLIVGCGFVIFMWLFGEHIKDNKKIAVLRSSKYYNQVKEKYMSVVIVQYYDYPQYKEDYLRYIQKRRDDYSTENCDTLWEAMLHGFRFDSALLESPPVSDSDWRKLMSPNFFRSFESCYMMFETPKNLAFQAMITAMPQKESDEEYEKMFNEY